MLHPVKMYSAVSDPWVEFTKIYTDRIMDRLSSLEILVRQQHLGTREYQAKGFRDVVSITRKMFREIQNSMHLALQGSNMLQSKHQADPALMSVIMALLNSALLYLNATAPATEGQVYIYAYHFKCKAGVVKAKTTCQHGCNW